MLARKGLTAALVGGAMLLSGCGGPMLQPLPMPSVLQVQAQLALTDSIPPTRVHDFYTAGLFVVQSQCGSYYDSAVMAALKSAQTQGETNALAGLAMGIMGLVGAGSGATAGVGIGTSFINGLLLNQATNSLAGTDPAAMSGLTNASQQLLINSIPEPASAADAWNALYAVWRQCSSSGIQLLKEQALSAAQNHLVVTGQPPAASVGIGGRAGPAMPRTRGIPSVQVR